MSPAFVSGRRRLFCAAAAVIALTVAVGGFAASLTFAHSTGDVGGIGATSPFLSGWQQTGVAASATPDPVPTPMSATVTVPTRLPATAGSLSVSAGGVAGHQALEWTFTETVGIPVNEEIELDLSIQYTAGAVSHNLTETAFLETQAGALGASLVFNLYWDAGAPAGITFGAESEISQVCSGVGTCP
ncbi:MAG: hypothetical protein WA547_02080 [Thermoplasmata archaeon]